MRMSTRLLAWLIILPTAAVVVAMFAVMWRERTTTRTAVVALIAGAVLAAWAGVTLTLALSGFYLPPETPSFPPVGIQLAISLAGLVLFLVTSPSLRSLLTNQKNLIRLNVWRLVGAVFLLLMVTGQMPTLWAIPSGIGDVIVGLAAFGVAARLDGPGGRKLAIIFNLFGLADLVVAVGLGIMTSPGSTQVFHTTPTSELVTRFPLALVPAFLVPLAFVLHFVSLWQLSGRTWVRKTGAP
jgi:hypothetical protein